MSANGYRDLSPDELEDELDREASQMGESGVVGGFVVPGPDYGYDDGWDMDLSRRPCPDAIPASYQVDARLWTGRFSPSKTAGGRAVLRESRRQHFGSRDEIEAYCESIVAAAPRKLREAWSEGLDSFAYGATGIPSQITGGGLTRQFLPLIPGPVTRQLYWQSYFEMSAKAFEAYNHDPITWRGIHLLQQFALGAGLEAKVTKTSGSGKGQTHDQAQQVWDDFWKRNRMKERLEKITRDASIMGELFIRYFKDPQNPRGLIVRSLDPASIYDIVTDPEDLETVFFYHQQFQTPYQLYAPSSARPPGGSVAPTGATEPGATTRYIIRQIDFKEIDHYKLNAGESERRGRSDLYPVLGWIKRLRDYLTSRVIQADMHSRFVYDLTVNGNPSDVAKARQAMFPGGQPPNPGAVLAHTKAIELNPIGFQQAATGLSGDATFEALVNIVAVGIGVPKEYLGITGRATRANALVATEPAAKRFEGVQDLDRLVLNNMADRVFAAAGITDAAIEFTFPSIATEERSAKLDDLGTCEANGWLSKQTSATIAAREMGIENYDFEEEQELIAAEFPEPEMEDDPDGQPNPITGKPAQKPKQGDGKPRRSIIIATKRQASKLDITKSPSDEDEPPGLLVPTDGSAPVTPGFPPSGGAPPQQTRGGVPADENPLSGKGAANIRGDNKVRESMVTLTLDELAHVVREAARPTRRRPDDPTFQQAAREFTQASAEHLGALVKAASR